jgi:nucleoside-diphosphate-sugar epimerase
MKNRYLVTGGDGFIGSALVRRLIADGHKVRVLDNDLRGSFRRLKDVSSNIEAVRADIRDHKAVLRACAGVDVICHLAFLNGTEFFYNKPELVLDIGVKGMVNIIDGAIAEGVPELMLMSSSEVYQTPLHVPTDETAALSVPDPMNPRYSYGGGKIISELMAINYGRRYFKRVTIVRPHNVYGPDMGWEHVIPQFAVRMKRLCKDGGSVVRFPIQGSGRETRAFVYIDDFIDGLIRVLKRGEHLGIYHIGSDQETTIARVADEVGRYFGKKVRLVPGKAAPGGTLRRCPDISKMSRLGYVPRIRFAEGLRRTVEWYDRNADLQPAKALKGHLWAEMR